MKVSLNKDNGVVEIDFEGLEIEVTAAQIPANVPGKFIKLVGFDHPRDWIIKNASFYIKDKTENQIK